MLYGGAGDDVLLGGDADTLIGGLGVDTTTGGAGADTIRLFDAPVGLVSSLVETDRVTDFTAAEGDRIDLLSGSHISYPNQPLAFRGAGSPRSGPTSPAARPGCSPTWTTTGC